MPRPRELGSQIFTCLDSEFFVLSLNLCLCYFKTSVEEMGLPDVMACGL